MSPASTRAVSEGGIAGLHPLITGQDVLVGPATGNEHNTIIAGIIPVACWRVEDLRFEFDSSIVRPEIQTELKHLTDLVNQHLPPSRTRPEPGHPLSVFGHADPTGNDDYNKVLSGRRATAIYALLTRRTDLWEDLFSRPFGNDKWGRRALEVMLDFTAADGAGGGPPPPARREDSVTQHERDRGSGARCSWRTWTSCVVRSRELAQRVWHEFWEDEVLDRAAALAYYFLFALFPALLFLTALFGLLPGPALMDQLMG